jgi:hypothetical protein
MTWTDFLNANASRFREARDWQAAGLSWDEVLRTWPVGNDLLWAAREMGLLDDTASSRVACTCVDAVADLAPDVDAIVGAVWQGDMTAAAFGAACILGNAEADDDETERIVDPASDKALFASTLLLNTDKPYQAMYHAAKARSYDDDEAAAHLVQADFVRWLLGGLA